MSREVTFSYVWDEATAIKASELFYRYELKHSPKRFLGWFFIAMSQFGVVGALKHDAYGLLILSTVFLIYWYYLRWIIRKRIALKYFCNSSMADQTFEVSVGKKGVFQNGLLLPWNKISSVIEQQDGFLLYTEEGSLFFPLDAFDSGKTRQHFRNIVKSHAAFTKE